MRELKKLPFPESRTECSACGFSAPESEFDNGHSKWCKRSSIILCVLIPFSVLYTIVGTLVVKCAK